MRALLPPLIVALALAVPASAFESCYYTTSDPEADTCRDAGAEKCYYFDWDWCRMECSWSFWIYEESNGVPGLQRDDEIRSDVEYSDGCIKGDTIIY